MAPVYYCGMRHMPCARSGGTAVPDPGPWAAGALQPAVAVGFFDHFFVRLPPSRPIFGPEIGAWSWSAARDPGCTTELERRAARRPIVQPQIGHHHLGRGIPTSNTSSFTPEPKPPSRYRHLDRLCIDVHVHRAPNHLVPQMRPEPTRIVVVLARRWSRTGGSPSAIGPRTPASTGVVPPSARGACGSCPSPAGRRGESGPARSWTSRSGS